MNIQTAMRHYATLLHACHDPGVLRAILPYPLIV